jgi:putative restriction endonuclease
MTSSVAITDFDWFTHLRQRVDWEEVNFWQPSSKNLLNQPRGMPFFFKLRASHGSHIVGFGNFSWSSKLPAWMAWEEFREANGAATRAEMLQRINRLRRDDTPDMTGKYEIGCLLIARPVFFDESDWVRPPDNWAGSIQRGKLYDLAEGEGRRIHMECLKRAARYEYEAPAAAGHLPGESPADRFGEGRLIRPRLGQGGFRVAVTDVYGRQCAISTEHSLPALEAAHIRDYAAGGEHDVRNGLLLRADIHRLFDRGFVTVTPEHQFKVSRRLRDEYSNGRVYYELQERVEREGKIHLPKKLEHYPDPDALAWHVREKFVG